MTNHQLKPVTLAERMERKRQAKGQRDQAKEQRKNYYQLEKYAGLKYDYSAIAEADRELVQQAALDIHRWQKDTLALGNTLLAVKEKLPHGQFLEWLKVEFDSGLRVLQQSMNVARMLKDDPKAHDHALLSADALYLLAAPSTPDTVRWEVFEHMEMLDYRPTRAQIKAIIDAHKPTMPKQLPAPVSAAPELEPAAIAAKYEIAPAQQNQRSPQDIAAELSLSECLMVLELAKEAARRARELEPATHNAVTDMLPSISRLIHKIEQELRK